MRTGDDGVHERTHRVYERTYDETASVRDGTAVAEAASEVSEPAPCPECEGRVITNAVETVCEDCGLVLAAERVDRGPTWTAPRDEPDHDDQRHTGAPRTVARHDDGLTTEIGRGRDANGNWLPGRKRHQLSRLRREHGRARFRSKRKRNLADGLSEIRRVAGQLGLSHDGRDHACRLFRRAQADDLLQGRSIEMIAMGAVHAACRMRQEVRPLAELVAVARCDRQALRRGYQVLVRTYELATPPFPLRARVARLTSRLEVSPAAAAHARTLAEAATAAELTVGRQRAGIAAACVYRATQAHPPARTQAVCADATDTTATTLRARAAELAELPAAIDPPVDGD
jgi:transcription initiation factor TFIIB